MMGRIKWLNQHPEAIVLMIQLRMFIPSPSEKLITSRTLYPQKFRYYMFSIL